VPAVVVGTETVAVEFAGMSIVVLVPLLIVYVAVTGNAVGFVKVIAGDASFKQTELVPLMVTFGMGSIVTVAEPEIGAVQGEPV
jgi:hypothetical protein